LYSRGWLSLLLIAFNAKITSFKSGLNEKKEASPANATGNDPRMAITHSFYKLWAHRKMAKFMIDDLPGIHSKLPNTLSYHSLAFPAEQSTPAKPEWSAPCKMMINCQLYGQY